MLPSTCQCSVCAKIFLVTDASDAFDMPIICDDCRMTKICEEVSELARELSPLIDKHQEELVEATKPNESSRNETLGDKCQHQEAFCLMLYKCKDCGAIEILWNSRDGVTPFGINCRNKKCKEGMQHNHWQLDTRIVDFKPYDGMRVFVDLTEEKCLKYLRKRVDHFWETNHFDIKERYETKEKATQALMESEWDPKQGSPDVIIWGEK